MIHSIIKVRTLISRRDKIDSYLIFLASLSPCCSRRLSLRLCRILITITIVSITTTAVTQMALYKVKTSIKRLFVCTGGGDDMTDDMVKECRRISSFYSR